MQDAMKKINNEAKTLTMKELFFLGKDRYVIPMYQRNYAWREGEIIQLLRDVADYANSYPDHNYYLGTLVVYNKTQNNVRLLETIDGQQRLTTLWMIFHYLLKEKVLERNVEMELVYECRPVSTFTLNHLAVYGDEQVVDNLNDRLYDGYKTIKAQLNLICNETGLQLEKFIDYFLENVVLIRVAVPQDTDLNHYFEIMNSRGEQLEKHEVLKAKLMHVLTEYEESSELSRAFAKVWDACSDMSRYVQMNFVKYDRESVFGGHWDKIDVESFDEIVERVRVDNIESKDSIDLDKLLSSTNEDYEITDKNEDDEEDEGVGKYAPIINFANFLLHVLRIMKADDATYSEDISLDDKALIREFDSVLKSCSTEKEKVHFVKDFMYHLLRLRFWLDNYVIHRDKDKEEWSLKKLVFKGKSMQYMNVADDIFNKELLMLQSMFHVSHPAYSYKQWLSGMLYYGYTALEPRAHILMSSYLLYGRNMIQNFMKYRFMNSKITFAYDKIIFNYATLPEIVEEDIDIRALSYSNVEYLVFNYIDFLYWKKDVYKVKTDNKFHFSARNSVEHHCPQNPIGNLAKLEDHVLNCIGNLCLVSASLNSKLSNYNLEQKRQVYIQANKMESIKQHVMFQELVYTSESVLKHEEDVHRLILNDLFGDVTQGILPQNGKEWFDYFWREDQMNLLRALFCFGDFSGEKSLEYTWYNTYNFKDRKDIERTDVYHNFIEFLDSCEGEVKLEEVIELRLKENEMQSGDGFSYVMAKYPEIMKYCEKGRFKYRGNPLAITLVQRLKETLYCSTDLYIYLLKKYIDLKYNYHYYFDRDGVYLFLHLDIEVNNPASSARLVFSEEPYDYQLRIYYSASKGKLSYELYLRSDSSNSDWLINNGWSVKPSGTYIHEEVPHRLELEHNFVTNIESAKQYIEEVFVKCIEGKKD